jgi:hypothetical protein
VGLGHRRMVIEARGGIGEAHLQKTPVVQELGSKTHRSSDPFRKLTLT